MLKVYLRLKCFKSDVSSRALGDKNSLSSVALTRWFVVFILLKSPSMPNLWPITKLTANWRRDQCSLAYQINNLLLVEPHHLTCITHLSNICPFSSVCFRLVASHAYLLFLVGSHVYMYIYMKDRLSEKIISEKYFQIHGKKKAVSLHIHTIHHLKKICFYFHFFLSHTSIYVQVLKQKSTLS